MITPLITLRVLTVEARTILWNGESHKVGVGWVNTSTERLTIETLIEEGKSKNQFIRFTCQEPKKFAECSWQWAPWVPEFTGTDISSADAIEVRFHIAGKDLPADFLISLRSPGDHHLTENRSLKKAVPTLFDGKWHRVRFQLAELYTPLMKFDRKHLINVIFAAWNEKGQFTFDFDDVTLIGRN